MHFLKNTFDVNFMEYASYVIKDRAIPHIDDGLKPVQRRILHTLFTMHDGNFHKVANVVGECMKYHPHGDASISSALVVLANKELFIDKQGNFGNLYTGDIASAARYIECRLQALAHEAMYNPDITEYEPSYDGRKKEPVVFPAKIPVLLAQGAEGIAVGMATKILPHNFIELMQAEINALENKEFQIYPDFQTGGLVDISEYNDGNGKVLVRAKMKVIDKKRIIIKEIPFGTSTESLVASIESASKKNKIKISSISDYTTSSAEIEIKLAHGTEAKDSIDALFAFTDCEISISTSLLLIKNNLPSVMSVSDVIKHNAEKLKQILTAELNVEAKQLRDKLHAKTLEQIFIEKRVYKLIEDKTTSENVKIAVYEGLDPYKSIIRREVLDEDIERLLKIPIRRISLYDINKAKKEISEINKRLKEIKAHLSNIIIYSIDYLKRLIEKYQDKFPRVTEIASIKQTDVREAAKRNLKLKYDSNTGYLGTEISSGKVIMDVSHYDRVLIIKNDGTYFVADAPEKLFVKGMIYCAFINKDVIFTAIYTKNSNPYIKRCNIEKFILNKSYDLIPKDTKLNKFTTAINKSILITYKPKPRIRVFEEAFNIDEYAVKGVKASGNRLSTREIKSCKFENNG